MSKIEEIAKAIQAAHANGDPFENLSGDLEPASIMEAYEAQIAYHALKTASGKGPIAGRKIALASAVQQELCGVDHPIAGGIFASDIMTSPATVNLSHYHGLGIEFEMAMRLKRDLTKSDTSFDEASILDEIDAVYPAFELIIDRKADYANLNAKTMISDNAWNGGVVLGPEIAGWRNQDLNAMTGTLTVDNEAPVSASTGDANPLQSLAWVINLVTRMGETVSAGDIVITGSIIKTRYPTGKSRMRYRIGDEAEVDLKIN